MPNHTDVRAYFVGEAKAISAMRRAMRQRGVGELARARAMGDWEAELKSSEHIQSKQLGGFGRLPQAGAGSPFTLQCGVPMPPSLLIEEGSRSEFGQDILSGDWQKYRHYKAYEERWRSAGVNSAESALAWAKEHEPEALELGATRMENIRRYGAASWYDWSVRNWGTKWDAYEQRWGEAKRKGMLQEVVFQTAWSPPLPALLGMCSRFGLDCVVGYVDEGGAFATYSILRADGEAELDVEDFCSSPRSLWPRARAQAARVWKEKAESGVKAKRWAPPAWAEAMERGDEPDEALIKGSRGWPEGESAADAVFDLLGEGGALDAQKALRWLRALSAAGALRASDPLSQAGCSIGRALAAGAWQEGFAWALEGVEGEERLELIRFGAARAIQSNAPAMAAMAYELLAPSERPSPKAISFGQRPEACAAIALCPEVMGDSALLEAFHSEAKQTALASRWDRLLEAFAPMERAVERARIDHATEPASGEARRPGL